MFSVSLYSCVAGGTEASICIRPKSFARSAFASFSCVGALYNCNCHRNCRSELTGPLANANIRLPRRHRLLRRRCRFCSTTTHEPNIWHKAFFSSSYGACVLTLLSGTGCESLCQGEASALHAGKDYFSAVIHFCFDYRYCIRTCRRPAPRKKHTKDPKEDFMLFHML